MNRAIFLMLTDIETRLPVYIRGVGHWDHQEPVARPEGYPAFQWLYCLSGEGELKVNGAIHPVQPGTGIFLYPDEPHEYKGIESWEVEWINFYGDQVEHLARLAGLHQSGVYGVTDPSLLLSHMRTAQSFAISNKPLSGLECSKAAYALLVDMTKCITTSANAVIQSYDRLQPILDYMVKNYSKVITLEELAAIIGVSSQHVCLLFRQIVKMRPMEYLNLLRIRASKELMLQEHQMRIIDIAHRVGFASPGYYSTLFKRLEGISPEAFRRLNGRVQSVGSMSFR